MKKFLACYLVVLLVWPLARANQKNDRSAKSSDTQEQKDWKQKQIVAGFKIFRTNGELIKAFPGEMCIFLNDGRFLSASDQSLSMYNLDSSIAWKIAGHFHHQINLSLDKKTILAIASENINENQKMVRYCVLMQIDLDGQIIHRLSTKKIIDDLKLKPMTWPSYWDKSFPSDIEATHFNSFYEVPPQIKSLKFLSGGEFVANSLELGTFVIAKDFSRAIDHFYVESSIQNNIHDVQIDKFGRIVYFNNLRKSQSGSQYSTVEILDLKTKKNVFEFQANPKEMFFSPACGGVQILEDQRLLISTRLSGYFIYNMRRKKIEYSNLMSSGMINWEPFMIQQIKLVELKDFLKHWQ